MNDYQKFAELHHQENPLVLGNVWDVSSALALEGASYQALGTSSAAMAHLLGYEDGEDMPFDEMVLLVKRIKQHISIPLSVDIESGYADDVLGVKGNILKLMDLGVAGINIEDSFVTGGVRSLREREELASVIEAILPELKSRKQNLFINARIDSYLINVPNKLKETISRIQLYEQAGASGVFIPLLMSSADIVEIVKSTHLPINLMAVPGLPSFDQLKKLGIRRISTGNFMHEKMSQELTSLATKVLSNKQFEPLFQ